MLMLGTVWIGWLWIFWTCQLQPRREIAMFWWWWTVFLDGQRLAHCQISLGYQRHNFGYFYRHQEGCSVLGSGRCWFHRRFHVTGSCGFDSVGTICLRDDLPGGLCDCDDLPTNHVDAEHVDDCFLQISGSGHWFLEGWIGDHWVEFLVDLGSSVPSLTPCIKHWSMLVHRWGHWSPLHEHYVAQMAPQLVLWWAEL